MKGRCHGPASAWTRLRSQGEAPEFWDDRHGPVWSVASERAHRSAHDGRGDREHRGGAERAGDVGRHARNGAPAVQEQMQLSFSKLGQLTPVQAWRASAGGDLEIFDGIKRWRAAQALSWSKLRVEVHALDAAGAKVRLLQLRP